MKIKFIAIALALTSVSVYAEESLSEMKSKASTQITERIDSLRSSQDCISGATTTEGFKACKYDMHDRMKMQKEEMGDDMKMRKDRMHEKMKMQKEETSQDLKEKVKPGM